MQRTLFTLAAMLVFSTFALADIARPDTTPHHTPKPKPEKLIDTEMDIRLDSDAKEAKLLIPKAQIKSLRAALEEMDDDTGNTAAVTSGGLSRLQTIVSGLFLSLAMVFGGVWFVRSGKAATKTAKTAVVALAIAGIATAATFVYANAGPPAEARSITGKMFSPSVHMYGFGWGRVKLGVAPDERIQLIVPDPKDKPSGDE
ncbi:MAG TPA: hypothetical protein VGO43_10400 [Pyrinomonadaceae bacterium]|jgi:hypothetical protein|nr:hypothetical protein [Pyrinomonadaceae bacterium]